MLALDEGAVLGALDAGAPNGGASPRGSRGRVRRLLHAAPCVSAAYPRGSGAGSNVFMFSIRNIGGLVALVLVLLSGCSSNRNFTDAHAGAAGAAGSAGTTSTAGSGGGAGRSGHAGESATGNPAGSGGVSTTSGGDSSALGGTSELGGTSSAAGADSTPDSGHLTITPDSNDFGKTTVGSQSATGTFTVTNSSAGSTPVLSVELSGADKSAFELVADTCTGKALSGGARCTVTARFTPSATDLGPQSATLQVTGSDSVSAAMAGEGLAPSALSAKPTVGQFDGVVLGSAKAYADLTFDVANSAGATSGTLSTLLEGTDAGEFALQSDACKGTALAGSAHCTIVVRFTPKTRGQKTATLLVQASPGGMLPISLSGRGLSAGAFSILPADSTISQPVTINTAGTEKVTLIISNEGDASATPQVTSSDATQFSLADSCSGTVIAAGATCSLVVTFTPTSVGSQSTVVSVTPAGASPKATIHAVGSQTRALTVAIAGNGTGQVNASAGVEGNGIACPGNCSETYNQTSVTAPSVTLTATYDAGTDVSWSAPCAGSTTSCSVSLAAASTAVTVTFNKKQFTLTVARSSASSGATGTVTGTGINCGTTCSTTVAYGATTALTAVPASGYYFGGWSGGGCNGGSLTCTVSAVTANTTVTAQFTAANVIFVTSAAYAVADWRAHDPMGANDAVRGADKFCQDRASAGSSAFTKGRNFVSLIAHGAVATASSFQSKLGNKRGWVRTDGLPFGDDLNSIVTNQVVFYPPALDENGARVASDYASVGSGCVDWTSYSINDYRAAGVPASGGYGWYQAYGWPCSYTSRLYCASTDYVATVTLPPPTAGRKMFVSDGLFTPGTGFSLTSADTLCQNEATLAGFGGVFKAFLASNTPASTAISRFSLTGATWVRPDGIPLVSSPADLASDNPLLLSPPQVSATLQYIGNSPVWTGAASAQTAATAVSSCTPGGGNSWSSAAVTGGMSGQPYFADAHYFNDNSPGPCTDAYRLYCFQQ